MRWYLHAKYPHHLYHLPLAFVSEGGKPRFIQALSLSVVSVNVGMKPSQLQKKRRMDSKTEMYVP